MVKSRIFKSLLLGIPAVSAGLLSLLLDKEPDTTEPIDPVPIVLQDDTEKAISFAKEWLKEIGEDSAKVSTEECKFCHTQSVPDDMEIEIMTNGYHIEKIDGCPE